MNPFTSPRDRFADGGLSTASGPKIVVLSFERLDRDLAGAIDAIEQRQIERAHELLCHAQDIVLELRCMLDLAAWEHAGSLSSIYRYVTDLLIEANIKKSVKQAHDARSILAQLGEAFREAAATPMPATPTPAVPAAAPAPVAASAAAAAFVLSAPRALSVLA